MVQRYALLVITIMFGCKTSQPHIVSEKSVENRSTTFFLTMPEKLVEVARTDKKQVRLPLKSSALSRASERTSNNGAECELSRCLCESEGADIIDIFPLKVLVLEPRLVGLNVSALQVCKQLCEQLSDTDKNKLIYKEVSLSRALKKCEPTDRFFSDTNKTLGANTDPVPKMIVEGEFATRKQKFLTIANKGEDFVKVVMTKKFGYTPLENVIEIPGESTAIMRTIYEGDMMQLSLEYDKQKDMTPYLQFGDDQELAWVTLGNDKEPLLHVLPSRFNALNIFIEWRKKTVL